MGIDSMKPEDRRFWAAIGIGAGLATFFQGISYVPIEPFRGWFSIGAGMVLLILGFKIANPRGSRTKIARKIHDSNPLSDTGGDDSVPLAPLNPQYKTELSDDRKWNLNALLDQSRSFDKYVLTLAAGTFGLSLVFLQQIAPLPQEGTVGILIGAWVAFGMSILMTLVSFLFSQASCQIQIDILDGILSRSVDPSNPPKNLLRTVTVWLNWLSMFVFIGGVALLMTFALLNLPSPNGG